MEKIVSLVVLVDATVKAFMVKYPSHIAVKMFQNAWHEFVFVQDDDSRTQLDTAIVALMQAAKGVVIVTTNPDAHDFPDMPDDGRNEDPYNGVTFH